MTKIALVLAIVAIGEGAVTLHLVNQLRQERDSAQKLQARVTELESKAPQTTAGATFIAVPTQPTVSPFTIAQTKSAPARAIAGVITANGPAISNVVTMTAPEQESMRVQVKQSRERQAALLRDPEYREAMLAQQKMGLRQSMPSLARDLDLTAEQADRLFGTMTEQLSANENELKRALGDAKYREYQEYQSLSGVRWEADRVRTALANAGVPLDENLTKPLLKTLQEQQQKMLQQMTAAAAAAPAQNSVVAVGGLRAGFITEPGAAADMVELQERSLEFRAQQQKRQHEALAHVLTPEQLKVIEEGHNAELQMQRAQLRLIRAQQEAGLLDPAQGGVVQDQAVTFTPAFHD
jgi:ribosomal protein L12E/L44/L45/RPP1/RPP2